MEGKTYNVTYQELQSSFEFRQISQSIFEPCRFR